MISESKLLELLADIETSQVERTISVGNTEKFCQAVCAFSNDFDRSGKPSYLLIGVDDSGRPSGLTFTDEMLRDLAGIGSDGNIQPLPAISIQRFRLQGGEVAVVETLPSPLPPVRYKGKVWIRIGSRRAVATEHEEAIRTLGYANRFGMGVARAARALQMNGNPPARFAFDPGAVDVYLKPSMHDKSRVAD